MYSSVDSNFLGTLSAVMGMISFISFVMCIIIIIAQWKIFKKAGEPGVASIVPFWNTAVLFKITWGKWYYMFLVLIPFAGIVVAFITLFKLAKVFGKDAGFGIGLVFLSAIFMPILAFGSAEYVGLDGQAIKNTTNDPCDVAEPVDFDEQDSPLQDDVEEFIPQDDVPDDSKSHTSGRRWSV